LWWAVYVRDYLAATHKQDCIHDLLVRIITEHGFSVAVHCVTMQVANPRRRSTALTVLRFEGSRTRQQFWLLSRAPLVDLPIAVADLQSQLDLVVLS
jgi:hypothetical protein